MTTALYTNDEVDTGWAAEGADLERYETEADATTQISIELEEDFDLFKEKLNESMLKLCTAIDDSLDVYADILFDLAEKGKA